eukprot:2314176-Rhodomonas_salina.1
MFATSQTESLGRQTKGSQQLHLRADGSTIRSSQADVQGQGNSTITDSLHQEGSQSRHFSVFHLFCPVGGWR